MPVMISNPMRRQIPRAWLSSACEYALFGYGKPQGEVSVVITNDAQLHELNMQYRGIDRPTDVLSFSLVVSDGQDPFAGASEFMGEQLGEVYISYQTAQKQSAAAGHSLAYELVFLAVHGVLHLLGYNDDTEEELAEMIRLGTSVLNETQ